MKVKFKIIISVLVLMFLAFFINGVFNSVILTNEIKKIRGEQIENAFITYSNASNSFFDRMEANSLVLSRSGEAFYNLHLQSKDINLQNEIEKYCLKTLKQFPQIIGNGIWYEPYKFGTDRKYFGIYAFWENDTTKITYEFSNPQYDYFNQKWYTMAIPQDWDKNSKRESEIFISSPYLDKLGDTEVIYITIAGMMYDKEGKVLGITTTDLTIDLLQKSLGKIYFSPNSFVFLIDGRTGKILYSSDKAAIMEQYKTQNWGHVINIENQPIDKICHAQNEVINKEKFEIFSIKDHHNLVFGFGVNKNEAYSIIAQINQNNATIVSIVLIIAGIILFMVITRLMMPLNKLNLVVTQFAKHDFSVRADVGKKDEVGTLSCNFNHMAESIQSYSKTLEDYNLNLENLVKERVIEIETQKSEIEFQSQQIMEQNIKLTDLVATKDKFFSIIAHDLRNPFNHLLGFTQLLEDNLHQYSKEEITEIVHMLHSSASNTYSLLENLLLWASTQRGTMHFDPQTVQVEQIVAQEVKNQAAIALKKGITLINSIQIEHKMVVDLNMIQTVFRNLILNALKFTSRGGTVTVSSGFKKDGVEFTVSDTGVGIESEIREKLFRSDQHFATQGTENEKGSGLGLVLCKEFVVKHGGQIWVESQLGEGSKFIFTLPLIGEIA